MKFLLLLHDDTAAVAALSPGERRAIVDDHVAYSTLLRQRGALVLGEPLDDPAGGTTVHFPANGGAPIATDGPFLESKESLGGFYVLECAERAQALELALLVPRSPGLVAELLPIAEM